MDKDTLLPLLEALRSEYVFYHHSENVNTVYLANARRFPAASVIKVPILLSWLWLERQGAVNRAEICRLDDEPPVQGAGFSWLFSARQAPFHDILLLMMAVSDNLCANLVMRRIGMDRLNQIFQHELGLPGTQLQRKMMDFEARARGRENWITAVDAIHLYDLVEQLSPSERAYVDGLLLANQDSSLLMRDIPRDSLDFYHKTGSLSGENIVLNDWGYCAAGRVLLFTSHVPCEPDANRIFGEVGRLALLG